MSNLKKITLNFLVLSEKIKIFAEKMKVHWIIFAGLSLYIYLVFFYMNASLLAYILEQILGVGSYYFDVSWELRDWFLLLKKTFTLLNKILISFSVLTPILYRYLKKNNLTGDKFVYQFLYALLKLMYLYTCFSFIILGTVLFFKWGFDYQLLGFISKDRLDSYIYFPNYQSVFDLISLKNSFAGLFFLVHIVLLRTYFFLIDNYLV